MYAVFYSNQKSPIPWYNRYRRFLLSKKCLSRDNNKSVFEKQPSEEKINLTLAILCQRVVDSGHSIKFNNEYYRFINKIGSSIYFHKGTKCTGLKHFWIAKNSKSIENAYFFCQIFSKSLAYILRLWYNTNI